ncbi:MAG TPA: mandelate racemase/muconate lactonizing enzyme family protein [Candidatus Limnocylindrales bacterium]
MKIVDLRVTVVGAPWRELTFVELTTDDGLTGLGEVRMVNKTETLVACLRELGPRYVIGTDPFEVERLGWQFGRGEYGRPGEVSQSALSAFDMASWDLMGQSLGVPIHRLLGGRFRERIPAYANGWYQAERDPVRIAELASGVVGRGYRALKLDPFGAAIGHLSEPERRLSLATVDAVRSAIGPDNELMIEMHGRFTAAEAISLARDLELYRPAWIEEPVPPENPEPLRRVRAATIIPIASGERVHALPDMRGFIDGDALDIVQCDLSHFGGFLPMKRLAGWADAHDLELAPHNVCGPVATAANIQFAAATPNVRILEHFNDFADPWVMTLVDEAPTVSREDGCFGVSDRPGLGVRLDHDVCAAHPATGARLQLFVPGWEKRAAGDADPA